MTDFNFYRAFSESQLCFLFFQSQLSEVSEGLPNIADLGVKLGTVEEKMTWELIFYRAFQGHDYQTEEEKPKIHPLVPLTPMEVKQISIRSKEMLELR